MEKGYVLKKEDIDVVANFKKGKPKAKYVVITLKGKVLLWTDSEKIATERVETYIRRNNKPAGLLKF